MLTANSPSRRLKAVFLGTPEFAIPSLRAVLDVVEVLAGVTIMYQSEALDAGDIILQRRAPIEPYDTAQTLEARLADEGARALVEALRLIAGGTAPRIPQDASAATYVKKLTKENGRLDWTRPARALANVIRAMDPWPSAYTTHRGRLLKIWKGAAIENGPPGPARPGTRSEEHTS